MSTAGADRNLLFGILALQMDFVSRDALIRGMNAWALEKAKPLGQVLVDQGELRDRIADAIAALPEREKLVVALYYYENLTLREIGEVLGVTESRVSQMHTKAVLRLRSRMQEESFDD